MEIRLISGKFFKYSDSLSMFIRNLMLTPSMVTTIMPNFVNIHDTEKAIQLLSDQFWDEFWVGFQREDKKLVTEVFDHFIDNPGMVMGTSRVVYMIEDPALVRSLQIFCDKLDLELVSASEAV